MSTIGEMIRDMCPDGVEYRSLGEVGTFTRGNGLQKSDFVGEGFPCVHYGQVHTRFGVSTDHAVSFVPQDLWRRLRHAKTGDLLIATTSEDDAAVGKATAWLGDDEVAVGGDAYIFSHHLDPKFVAYFFASESFAHQKMPFITGAKVRRLTDAGLSRIRIPVPPVAVQQELVRVLDQFTRLEAELEAELEARREQYAYYRDRMLEKEVFSVDPLVPLRSLGSFVRGKRFTKADYVNDGIPCIHYGEVYTRYGVKAEKVVSHVDGSLCPRLRFALSNDVILVDVGETVEDVGRPVAWVGHEPVAIHDHCYAFRSDLDPVYVSHVMRTSWFLVEKAKYVARTKVKTLLIEGFSNIKIPVPPLEEQRRLADVLDRFDALVNDLSTGLPAELEARRRQYEYYRDRLLTFPEKR